MTLFDLAGVRCAILVCYDAELPELVRATAEAGAQVIIVPTALTYHDGTNWPSDYANDLFMTSYDDQVVRRFQVSGPTFSEIDDEEVFAEFALQADDNKPLYLFQSPDGSLYVVTFKGIWRIQAMDSSN